MRRLNLALKSEQIQDANSKVHLVSDPTLRLFCDHQIDGCILSHPDRQETREVGDVSVGRHPLVSRFMQGARRLRPFHSLRVPSWDLSIVLEGLSGHPFEYLESVSVK